MKESALNGLKIFVSLYILALLMHAAVPVLGADADYRAQLKAKVEASFPVAVEARRFLHACPEPCFNETETSKYVAAFLKKLGLDVHTGIGKTGIKAILRGGKPGPTVGIRGDMDALPILENTGLPFASKNKGYMHACGHDAHTANVLIAAKVLSEMKDQIPGTVVFVFQPCEEGTPDGSPSGAKQMVADGVLDNPKIEAMFGLHVMPAKVGTVAFRAGPLMANVATVFLTIKGKASHGAFPNEGIDAIYAGSMAVVQFQSIISRIKSPLERAVLSIGKFNGGVRMNVIADEVKMEGTIRTFSFETQDLIEQEMEKVLKGLQMSLGISYDFKFLKGGMYLKNDKILTDMMLPVFKDILGEKNVEIIEPITGGEDFAVYSHRIPSFFFFLGVGENQVVHTPTFTIDEESLKYGPLLLASAALEYMYREK